MDLCDQIGHRKDGPKDGLKSITRRLYNEDPHVVMQAITVQLLLSFFLKVKVIF